MRDPSENNMLNEIDKIISTDLRLRIKFNGGREHFKINMFILFIISK